MKVQRLEKLCRALQIERNELSKKVQDLSNSADGRGSDTEAEPKSSQPATDSAECSPAHTNDPETPPIAHSQACHCSPVPEAESQRETFSAQD